MPPRLDRILIFTTDLSARGGVQLMSRMTAASVARAAGTDVRVDVRTLLGEPPAIPGARIVSANGNRAAFSARALADAVAEGTGTLAIALHLNVAPVTIPLILRGARVVVWLHGVEAWRPLAAAQSWVARRAWKVIAVSRYSANRFLAANPNVKRSVEVCGLGLADAPVPPPASTAPRRALIVSRLTAEDAYKGHDTLIQIWPEVRARIPDAVLTIVGDGDDRHRLQSNAADAGLDGSVVFEGEVSDERLRALMADSAYYVMPSPNEGFGLTFLEAMRAGRPCIAAPGAAEEVLVDGTTGFVVSPSHRDDLASAVVQLFEDRALRDRMGRAGRARYEAMFTEAHFAARLKETLEL